MNHSYTRTAIFFHWLMAVCLIGTFAVGFFMSDLPLSPTKLQVYSWHKWVGIGLLVLVAARLSWRLTHAAPPMPAGMSAATRLAAHGAHWVLYALMLAIPLSGWTMSSAVGFPVVWFGVLQLPDLVPKDKALGAALKQVHQILNYAFLAVFVAHVAAALKHCFIDRDDVFARMLPGRKRTQ